MRRLTLTLTVVVVSCGSNPSSNPSAYCSELAARLCDQQISCGKLASSHRRDCIESLHSNFCGVRTNEANRGLFKLNEKLTKTCLADLKTSGCTREGTYLDGVCFAAIEPAVATGGKCETDSHCRDTADRCIGIGCDRTCQAAGASGQPCRPGAAGVGSCNAGLTCDADGKCSPGGLTGSDCSTALPCNGDNFCDNTTDKCIALPPIGQACRFGFPQCVEAAYCAGLSCAARLTVGSQCQATGQCVVGTSCRAGTCTAQAVEGAACQSTADCATGLACDVVTLVCSRPKRAFFEEACTSTSVCYGGLQCRNLKPSKGGVAGSAGTCGVAAAGDSCFTSAVCSPTAFCQLPATVGDPGVCTTNSSGATCTSDDDCPESESCHRMDLKCVSRVSIGGSCALASCGENSSCVRRGAASVCVELADLNATCSNDMVRQIPCRSPLICARSTCISAGRKGEACLGSGTTASCFAGSCLDGICTDQRPDGATCRQDSDCLNAACERGICVQQCR